MSHPSLLFSTLCPYSFYRVLGVSAYLPPPFLVQLGDKPPTLDHIHVKLVCTINKPSSLPNYLLSPKRKLGDLLEMNVLYK